MNYLSACCIAKQEHAYLEEWIDYHLRVGVEHFFIYDDGDPGDQPLAELLAGHVARGTVEVRRAPAGARKQMLAYEDCLRRDAESSVWVAFFDVDEFLVPRAAPDVRTLLASREGEGGFGVNWLVYGSSGHAVPPPGGVIASYVWRSKPSFKANTQIKSIVRPTRARAARNPHAFDYAPGFHCVNERGRTVDDAWCRHGAETIQINHYFTKSRQEFMAKAQKGRAEGGRFTKRFVGSFDSAEEMFDYYDRKCSVVEDRFIQRYVTADAPAGAAGAPAWRAGSPAGRTGAAADGSGLRRGS